MIYCKQVMLLIFLFFSSHLCSAQVIDTALTLEPITVIGFFDSTAPIDDSTSQIPLISLSNTSGTLGNILANHSPIFIKNYGAGQLASSSIRGGSASHTTLKWNGISLQSPMLGQVDLASFPAFFIDKVALSYGNEHGLNATEIGAAIHLDNLPLTQVNHRFKLHTSLGSFGQYELGVDAYFKHHKWNSRTRIFGGTQKNNYRYKNLNGNTVQQDHAQKDQLGILQEIAFKFSPQSQWMARIWFQKNHRLIPKNKLQSKQVAEQKNESIRTQLSWTNNTNSTLNFAFIDDDFIYDDQLKNIHSLNHTHTFHTSYQYQTKAPFLWAIHYQYSGAKTNNYDQNKSRQEWKGEAQYKYKIPAYNTRLLIKLQMGITDHKINPILPTISLQNKGQNRLHWQWSIARKYRLPSFNDLYWSAGGNPDLNPEKGWESAISADWNHPFEHFALQLSSTLFGKVINQWIIWQPDPSGLWSPFNAQRVGSRGLEFRCKIHQSKHQFPWSISGKYHYTRSTQLKTKNNPSSLGKQLIYQPQHVATIKGFIQIQKWDLSYNHKITGKVFTTTDHSDFLSGYGIGALSLEREWTIKKHQLVTTFQIENIWNKDYEAVAFYPMPGRNWHLNIFYHF